jgi:hydrogenase-4 component B
LPLFNGFISEFIIYVGLFYGLFHLPLPGAFACAVGILALALMGSLALACFSKVYGTVFLGQSRHHEGPQPQGGTSLWMLIPMLFLGGLCLWIGLFPKTMASIAFLGGAYLSHAELSGLPMDNIFLPLSCIISGIILFLALVVILVLLRRKLLQGLNVPAADTWCCGFSQITPKLQYTSSSFALLIVSFVKGVLFFKREGGVVRSKFPGRITMTSSVHDFSEKFLFKPLFVQLTGLSKKLDINRIRYTQMHLMYILLYLVFLLVWKLK